MLKKLLFLQGIIFLLILSFFLIPFPDTVRHALFPYAGFLALVFLLLGILLMYFTKKKKVTGKLKTFLILTGASSSLFLTSVILHNLLYALETISSNIVFSTLLGFLHVFFFIIAIPVCPLVFLIGMIGSMILFIKEKK